jgi:enamine deaminase RidA (YjgF/YER057c/UK114 family)
MSRKEVIGAPLVIDGRVLSLSRAVRAGDFIFITGQVPMRDGKPMTDGSIEDQTRACASKACNRFSPKPDVISETS